ncbi:hypothetical protein JD969_16965 [Planctomycetota bacterium]|nr:hypothetical protein JD969_16965 [Planctomycetota bacterium]
MSVKANIRTGFRGRYGIIALVLLGFMLYCLYDGLVAYPNKKMIYETYMEIRYPNGDMQNPNDNWVTDWQDQVAKFKDDGIKVDGTEQPEEKTQGDIYTQFIMAGISGVLGLLAGGYFLSIGGSFVEADEQGISSKKSQKISWDKITSVDISRWESKGIAVLHFDDAGKSGIITLDDWKFDREPTVDIFKLVKTHTDHVPHDDPNDGDADMDEIA